MLINFSTKNFKSFKNRTFLALNAEINEKDSVGRFTKLERDKYGLISHVAGVFGANGAGKSNLIEAMDYSKHLIQRSATNYTQGDELYCEPFKLSQASVQSPSEYEYLFQAGSSVYRYGFSHTSKRILEEWLFETPLKKGTRQRKWFTREYKADKKTYDWYINDEYISGSNSLKAGTRENALFLSSAVRDNSKEVLPAFLWFKNNLHMIASDERLGSAATAMKIHDGDKEHEIKSLLERAGIKFDDIQVHEEEIDKDFKLPTNIPTEIKKMIVDDLKGSKTYKSTFLKKDSNGNLVKFDFEEESSGTQVLYGLAWPLIDVLSRGSTLVVDELHNNLHPHLLRFIIKLFNDQKGSMNKGQLIFSSHEPSVMRADTMSQEQIWFVEKDTNNISTLYCLDDFKNRRTNKVVKPYLDGRFGAIPKIVNR